MKERETDGQTDRQTDRDTEREKETETQRERESSISMLNNFYCTCAVVVN